MSERKYKTVATQTGVVIDGYTGRIFKMANGLDHKNIGSIEAADYPAGARVTVTIEEPEPPKERVVLPEGMRWENDILWTSDGAKIAGIKNVGNSISGWYCVPFTKDVVNANLRWFADDVIKEIENALAEHGYFGVRKVVEND